jgi:hypothetical protein
VRLARKEPLILAHFRRFCNEQKVSEELHLAEGINIEATCFDDALEGSPRDRFISVHGDDHLPAISMTPFLMAPLSTGQDESISIHYKSNSLRSQKRENAGSRERHF